MGTEYSGKGIVKKIRINLKGVKWGAVRLGITQRRSNGRGSCGKGD